MAFFFIFALMRGQKSLFGDLFTGSEIVQQVEQQQQRPRNYHQPERNKALVYRYYYHAEINRKRYDDCLAELEREFYLTTPRLIVLLTECNNLLRDIITTKPTVKDMESLFPHFNWRLSRLAVVR